MIDEKRFLVDVGMDDLPFPMRVASRADTEGQFTIATISIAARIMHEFEAGWIDKFIQIVHEHRGRIGTNTLRVNILDYLKELRATAVAVDFRYPFFVEKRTPVSNEKCLVRYLCTYSVKVTEIEDKPRVLFKIEVPIITTYPGSSAGKSGGLFGQLTKVFVEIESQKDVYPEDVVELVDRHALAPVYSFLTHEDQLAIIQKVHSQAKSSVVTIDEIKDELARDRDIGWYSVRCLNYGMLHSYSTAIHTEKSAWVPFSSYEGQEI